ncbi:hypothetical protein FRC11_005554, partial [Ceratobasidium sp. 423]
HLQRFSSWFVAPSAPIRDALITRLKGSMRMIWTLSLGTKLFQARNQDPRSTTVRRYIGWIDDLEERFTTQSYCNPPTTEIADRLMIQLELVFLKFIVVDCNSGYILLRKALPKFLQLVAANNLYTVHPNGNLVVSFARTLGTARYELKRFVLYDTAAALVLGVPPLVEYGYDDGCDSELHGLEWIHGAPFALVEIISQINSWRATRATPPDDWHELEKRVLAWEPHPLVPGGKGSSAKNATRFAVQEGWRHVVLIYIYM